METAYTASVRPLEETGIASGPPHYANTSLDPRTPQVLSSHYLVNTELCALWSPRSGPRDRNLRSVAKFWIQFPILFLYRSEDRTNLTSWIYVDILLLFHGLCGSCDMKGGERKRRGGFRC